MLILTLLLYLKCISWEQELTLKSGICNFLRCISVLSISLSCIQRWGSLLYIICFAGLCVLVPWVFHGFILSSYWNENNIHIFSRTIFPFRDKINYFTSFCFSLYKNKILRNGCHSQLQYLFWSESIWSSFYARITLSRIFRLNMLCGHLMGADQTPFNSCLPLCLALLL